MQKPSPWMRYVLIAAAIHNFAWSAWAIAFPVSVFHLAGIPEPIYPELWQTVGLLIGVYGIGYGIAATDPLRHWPLVATGLICKVLGPLGFAIAAARGRFPWSFGWPALLNEVVWWLPFGLILKSAYDAHVRQLRASTPEVLSMAMRTPTDSGVTIDQLSRVGPVLLVFLRHAGCTFCREALDDIAKQRNEIESEGATVVLVHMGDPEFGRQFFRKYGLDDVAQISNPSQALYRAFGLRRGTAGMLLGPRVWLRGFDTAILRRHGFGAFIGDVFQMPGVFLIFHGQVLRSFRHRSASDRPDYSQFVRIDISEALQ
jgi:peroxiredoxin